MKNRNVLYIRNVTPALKRAYKAVCARKGRTMTDDIKLHMEQIVQENEPDEVKKMRLSERRAM